MDLLDSRDIKFACTRCGKQLTEKLGRLKKDPTITCPHCKQRIVIDASGARAGLNDVSKAMDKLRSTIKKIGKP